MKIAVNTRFLLSDYLEGYGNFLFENFIRITRNHPEHEFIFLFDRPYDQRFVFSDNITPVVVTPAARHPILWKIWYDIRIPGILKKYKADVFVSCDSFCSLTTKVPQCLVVHDLSFLHFPKFLPKSQLLYLKRYTPKFLRKATTVATVSQFSRNDMVKHYPIDEKKISVVGSAVKEIFRPIEVDTKEAVRNKYTEGKQYFLYTGAIHPRKNLVNVLKAFSIFKKKQTSNFRLVIAGRMAWKNRQFAESLKNYKYRNDVVLTGYVPEEELVQLTGAAYAMVYCSLYEGFGVPVLEAMRCGVPVITSSNSSMQEIAGDAALFADPANFNEIAEKMLLLYKDEQLGSKLVAKGIQREREFSWDKTSELLWESIMMAAKK